MALDGTTVRPVPGTLTYTPNGGSAQALGYTEEGIELMFEGSNVPILPEELAGFPLDHILLGGRILAICTAMQWDAPTRHAVASWAISSNSLVIATTNFGKKYTDLNSYGALAFAPNVTGHCNWTAAKAVPLFAERDLRPKYRKRSLLTWSIVFSLLPPSGGGTIVTLDVSS